MVTLLDRTTLKDGTVFLSGSTAAVDGEGRIRRLITIPGTPT